MVLRRPVEPAANATSTPAALAAKAATATIPIVFTTGGDPVQLGLVVSMSRPNGNITGASQLTEEIGPKRLELAHDLVPAATVIVVLVNPGNPIAETQLGDIQAAAGTLGLNLHVLRASDEREIGDAFAAAIRLRAGVLLIVPTYSSIPGMNSRRTNAPPPAAYPLPISRVHRGGRPDELWRRCSRLLSRSGRLYRPHSQRRKARGSAVQQTTKVELIINLKTAKTLGLTIPQSLLVRANEVTQ